MSTPSQPPAPRAVDRRAFVRAALGTAGGALALPTLLAACASNAGSGTGGTSSTTTTTTTRTSTTAAAGTPGLGIQLYTLREALGRDLPGTLAALAAIGYREVELAGLQGQTAAGLRALLDRNGLRAPAGHVPLQALRANLNQTLDDAAALGHAYAFVPYVDQTERTLDGYRRIAGELNRFAEAARTRGMTFGYHNHDFEFQPLAGAPAGQVPYDILLAGTDPALVKMELDVFWTVKAGRDPLALFAQHPGRFAALHVKDATAAPERRMVNPGEGTIDFATVIARGTQAGVRHLFVEHDQPADAMQTARVGYQHVQRLLAAR